MLRSATVEESPEVVLHPDEVPVDPAIVGRVGSRLARRTPATFAHAVADWVHDGVVALLQAPDRAGVRNPAGYLFKAACCARARDLRKGLLPGVDDTFAAAPPPEASPEWTGRLRALGVRLTPVRALILELIGSGVRSDSAIARSLGRHRKTVQEHRIALRACLLRVAQEVGVEVPPALLAEIAAEPEVRLPEKWRRPRTLRHSVGEGGSVRTPNPEPRTPNPEPRTPNPEPLSDLQALMLASSHLRTLRRKGPAHVSRRLLRRVVRATTVIRPDAMRAGRCFAGWARGGVHQPTGGAA